MTWKHSPARRPIGDKIGAMTFTAPSPAAGPLASGVLPVSELNRRVRHCLESSFPTCWVSGEISNLTQAASGHVYFTLKDAQAQVRCVMWRNRAQLVGWRLANGQQVEARASLSFYEPRGEFQLSVEALRRAGQGDLFERYLRLKAQLEAEGLFAAEAKRPLPRFPRHLAIVTSPQAAALRDVLTTLRRRAPHVRLTLCPTPVQGEGAAEKIAAAIAQAGRSGADAVILCRGGGSIEDLWSFNEECVARALRACPLPVVSGVGHETDFTIADFAADLRAPTPTAAAELAAPDAAALRQRLDELGRQLARRSERRLAEQQQYLDWLASRLVHPAERLRQQGASVAQLGERLRHGTRRHLAQQALILAHRRQALQAARPDIAGQRQTLAHLARRLERQAQVQHNTLQMKLNGLERSLKQLDPLAVLARGYAIAYTADGQALRDSTALAPGHPLHLRLARGEARATVTEVVAPAEAE